MGIARATGHGPTRGELLAAAAVAVLAVLLAAWPWVREVARAIPDAAAAGNAAWGADARLILWILAWDVHALFTQPLHFFDANIFHPAPGMLAGSEHFLGSAILFAPLYLASGNAVLAANLVVLATYVLAAVAMYACLRTLALSPLAAAVGGGALPLCALRVPGDLHVLQYPNYLFALLIVAVAHAAATASRRAVVALAGVTLLALLSSYFMAAMALALLAIELAIVAATQGSAALRRVAIAVGAAVVVFVVVSLPYFRALGDGPPPPAFDFATTAAFARVAQPLALRTMRDVGGAAVPWLALLGLVSPLLRRAAPTARWWRWLAIAAIGGVFAIGPAAWIAGIVVPLPGALLPYTPLRWLKAGGRFVVLWQVGVVGLAAEGAALALESARRLGRTARATLGVALIAGAAFPPLLHLADQPRTALPVGASVPPVYRWLATQPREPLLEIPGPGVSPGSMLVQGDVMYASTFHWLPLVNGHTGTPPWWMPAIAPEIAALPDPVALQAIVDLTGVRWILVRRGRVSPATFARWQDAADGTTLAREPHGGDDLLLRVLLPARRPWAASLARGPAAVGMTATGTSLAALDEGAAHGVLHATPPTVARGGSIVPLRIEVTNDGTADWPAMLPPWMPDAGLVLLEATWRDAATPAPEAQRIRLPRDVAADDRVVVDARVRTPERPGTYLLEVRLVQVDGATFARSARLRAPVEVTAMSPR